MSLQNARDARHAPINLAPAAPISASPTTQYNNAVTRHDAMPSLRTCPGRPQPRAPVPGRGNQPVGSTARPRKSVVRANQGPPIPAGQFRDKRENMVPGLTAERCEVDKADRMGPSTGVNPN